jgi:class 3 adenylate cyclase
MRCGACDRQNRDDARFCDSCGAPLQTAPAPTEDRGERRQITILFCDLVDSVTLSTHLDPEDFGQLMREYEAAGHRAVSRYDGHVAQYLGDGLVVYFGYPQAHERASELAVHAGLALLEEIAAVEHEHAANLAVRVGIHTGEVVVQPMGRGDRRDPLALGDVVNIAARAQSLTDPNTVAVTATTHRLVPGSFAVESLGFPTIKGVDQPLELLRVLGPADAADAALQRQQSPFVGRRAELDQLERHWRDVCDRQGRVVHIAGEPGIGKSRLVDEFRRGIVDDHLWLECRGAPHTQQTPFSSVAVMVTQAFAWKADVPNDERLDDLDAGLEAAGIDPRRIGPLVASLLGLAPEPGRYPGEMRTSERQREELQDAMVRWLLAVAQTRPLVVLTEDRQWLDPSSLELLDRMIEAIEDTPVLMLQTERVEAGTVRHGGRDAHEILLPRLDHGEVAELIERLAPSGHDADVLARIAARADGVPLFLEEVLRTTSEDGQSESVPSTLRDALAARLDRLGDAKPVAQTASVLGLEFSAELLGQVADLDEAELQGALARLEEHEIAEPVGARRSRDYRFTHGLLQETAYASVLRARRQELHSRVADVMAASLTSLVEHRPEMLAHHLTGAGRIAEAIAAWERASRQAFSASALAESEAHVRTALGLVDQLGPDEDPIGVEMGLQILLGRVASATHGMASSVVRQSYARALELGESVAERPRVIGMLFGAWGGAFSHGDVGEATRHVDALLREWDAAPDPGMLGWVRYAQAATSFAQGDMPRAGELLDEIFGAGSAGGQAIEFGLDITTVALTHRLLVDWHLGRIGHAVATAERFRIEAESASSWELAMTLMASCCLFIQMSDRDQTRRHGERLRALGAEAGLPTHVAWADLYLGWALADGGDPVAGIESMRRGLAGYLATDQRTGHPGYLRWIAAAQCSAGDPTAAMETITEAETALPQERNDVPAILTVRGEILERAPGSGRLGESAELCYQQAVAAAQSLGSVMAELVATRRLARLRALQGDVDAPRTMLEPLLARVDGGRGSREIDAAVAAIEENPEGNE